jgi:xanthine dehydrogenase YagR molybdenum-binding subunit
MPTPKMAKLLRGPTRKIGKPLNRIDGPAKVTGAAKYSAEHNAPGLLHGVAVSSGITKGRITSIDTSAALALPGVVYVFTHLNRPKLAWFDHQWKDEDSPRGTPFRPLYDEKISHAMQPVALVVARSFEAARAGARLVKVEYEAEPPNTDLSANRRRTWVPGNEKMGFEPPPKPKGDANKALLEAEVRVDNEYTQAADHHNPLELFGTTVVYGDEGSLTVYEKTQGVQGSQKYICNVFGLKPANVRVLSPFVGGAFGSALRAQYQLFFAVMASLQLKRSVRVELTRQQMFTIGHRPQTIQRVALGARSDGTLTSIIHEALQECSQYENYVEIVVNWAGLLYQSENVRLESRLARLDLRTPIDMRAPGAATGIAAVECAIDELAEKLQMDPIELRLKNYTDQDPVHGKPFSSKELKACFKQGAERFGWKPAKPRSRREGRELIGHGMAVGMWDAMQGIATAKAVLSADGKLTVSNATADIGTGTYTVMTQIAAESLGLPYDSITFKLGDSSLPASMLEGGSWTVATNGSAVKLVCDELGDQLIKLAHKLGLFGKTKRDELTFDEGFISSSSERISIVELMRRSGVPSLEATEQSIPYLLQRKKHTFATHSAVFVEVRVDEELGMMRVSRVVSAIAAGRIINPKTARSQILGAIVGGIGQALHEETMTDHALGRYMNHDLAEYHVPANADIGDIEVIFVDEHDEAVNALGAKGVGEIGIVGVPAAVANAIYNATRKRVRDFPITLDKLL